MSKVIVITGASSGLGLSHAIYLTHLGHTVFGTSRAKEIDKAKLKAIYLRDHTKWKFVNKEKNSVKEEKIELPKKIQKNLDHLLNKIIYYQMDVTSEASIKTAFEQMTADAKKLNGKGIDVVVNNAGIGYFSSVEESSMEEWENTFETNVFGPLRIVKSILPEMKTRREGLIINTSSMGAIISIPFQSHYSASKSAIKLITEGLMTEVRDYNIKVTCLLPSDVNTNFNKNTVGLNQEELNGNLTSVNIGEMLQNNPVNKNSTYYKKSQNVWEVIIKNLIVSPPPIAISKTVAKIIKAKNPKVNYQSGSLAQKFLIFLIRRIVSNKFAYTLLPKYYGM